MSSKTFFEAIRVIIVVTAIGLLVVAGIARMNRGFHEGRELYCADLGTQLGYETELISNHCFIKVRPGLKVREDLILHYLPVIDCR